MIRIFLGALRWLNCVGSLQMLLLGRMAQHFGLRNKNTLPETQFTRAFRCCGKSWPVWNFLLVFLGKPDGPPRLVLQLWKSLLKRKIVKFVKQHARRHIYWPVPIVFGCLLFVPLKQLQPIFEFRRRALFGCVYGKNDVLSVLLPSLDWGLLNQLRVQTLNKIRSDRCRP